jgi:DNA ligase-1
MIYTLYKIDHKGKTRVWQIELDGDRYRTISGLVGGKTVTSMWTAAEEKNVGKANHTNPEQQALLEVHSLFTKKVDKGYSEELSSAVSRPAIDPMLAKNWEDRLSKINFNEGLYFQPKLDGIRCIITKDGAFSRNNKQIVSIPHILAVLAPVFELQPDLVLDGELYNHQLKDNFNKIVSLVRKTKLSEAEYAESASLVQYHVYDIDDGGAKRFVDRLVKYRNIVNTVNCPSVIPVPTAAVYSIDEADRHYAQCVTDGYEGGIYRINARYENKRSNNLIKRKDFNDDEFTIVRIESGVGNWQGLAKRVIFDDHDGRQFAAGLAGDQQTAKRILEQADDYVGKQGTVQFFGRTPDGVPRFPIAKALHIERRM